MNMVIHDSKLTAPGRMDVVEKVLRGDPFFSTRMTRHQLGRKNRRGVRKRYNELTVQVVMNLAKLGLDAAKMRRDEVIARAFEYCELGEKTIAA
jgi:hypothetical protein